MGDVSASVNPFIGLAADDLATLRTVYLQAVATVAVAGASYVMNGRNFTSADLTSLKETLFQINQAIASAAGLKKKFARPVL